MFYQTQEIVGFSPLAFLTYPLKDARIWLVIATKRDIRLAVAGIILLLAAGLSMLIPPTVNPNAQPTSGWVLMQSVAIAWPFLSIVCFNRTVQKVDLACAVPITGRLSAGAVALLAEWVAYCLLIFVFLVRIATIYDSNWLYYSSITCWIFIFVPLLAISHAQILRLRKSNRR
jgi:hypothetical protein